MNDYGTMTAEGELRFERLLPGPIERVWDYLTDSEKRGSWLASGEIEPHAGGAVELHFLHSRLSPVEETIPEKYQALENGVSFTGRVLRYEPPRILSHTWVDDAGVSSEVTYELTPVGDEVRLVLTHRRLPRGPELVGASAGWHTHLGILADRLRGETPRAFWATHNALETEYESRLAAS